MTSFIKNQQKTSSTNFDMPVVETMRKFSMQVITSTAFGLKVDAFHPSDEIIPVARRLFTIPTSAKVKMIFIIQFPKVAKFLKMKVEDVEGVEFFWGLISSALKLRQESGVKGNDFLQVLVDAINSKEEKGEIDWSEDLAIPQAFAFIAAGFDTIANNLSVACYVLATHPEVQEELYREVEKVMKKGGEKVSYEEINEMEYLDMVVSGKVLLILKCYWRG